MKILHLLCQRPDSTGSGIYLQAMFKGAAAKGCANFVLAGIPAGDYPQLPEDECDFVEFGKKKIPFPIVGMSDVMPYPSSRFSDLTGDQVETYEQGFEKKLKRIVEKFQPDLIHSHHLWIVTSLARRLFPDLPVVTTCHGSDLRQFENCVHLQKKVLSGCGFVDRVMALTEIQKNKIHELYKIPLNTITVVGAGYNETLFNPEIKSEQGPVQITYAGKLSLAKGVPWLLRALDKVPSQGWRFHLVGGGSGQEEKTCLELAGKLGDRVKIYGAIPQTQLAQIIKKSHLFVFPSFYEGLPLVVMEALASGCRIVATDLPGVQELFSHMDADFIRLVQTPRLHGLDTPFPEDEAPFERALTAAIDAQVKAAANTPQIDLTHIQDQISQFTWDGVFEQVFGVYHKALSAG